jgi:tetraacyldisaccharide 4'-kinase
MMFSPVFIERLWYGKHPLSLLLAPASWLYAGVMLIRALAYNAGILPVRRIASPVIIVGNITAGGTGKTPLVIWLAGFLQHQGYRPGVISRGYGGTAGHHPQQVRSDSDPLTVGDEPVLIARRTGVPVAVCADRYLAARELIEHTDCNILISDDGLQHLALFRDLEILVIDGDRRFGNGRCLPAGPLREPAARIESVDMIVSNGNTGKYHVMELVPTTLKSLTVPGTIQQLDALAGKKIHAVAGIGNPERFFSVFRNRRIEIIKHIFPDHHVLQAGEISFADGLPVVMTEKDAVKCQNISVSNCWYLPVEARMHDTFVHRLTVLLKEITHG